MTWERMQTFAILFLAAVCKNVIFTDRNRQQHVVEYLRCEFWAREKFCCFRYLLRDIVSRIILIVHAYCNHVIPVPALLQQQKDACPLDLYVLSGRAYGCKPKALEGLDKYIETQIHQVVLHMSQTCNFFIAASHTALKVLYTINTM